MISLANPESLFKEISRLVASSLDTASQWQHVLELTDLSKNPALTAIDFHKESALIAAQVGRVLQAEPPPRDMGFVYFGLFEQLDRTSGLYVAGGTNSGVFASMRDGELSYFPDKRFIHTEFLGALSKAAQGEATNQSIFGAILAKHTVTQLEIKLPTFVGFDSGDYAQIAN